MCLKGADEPEVGGCLIVASTSGTKDSGPVLRPELPMGQRQGQHGQQILKRLSNHFGSKPRAFGHSPLSPYFTEGGRITMINMHLLPLI